MKLVIMFCNLPEVEIRDIPDDINDIEEYIDKNLGYNTDELSWQCYDNDDIAIKIC